MKYNRNLSKTDNYDCGAPADAAVAALALITAMQSKIAAIVIPMGESSTVVSAYTMYRHLQQYCSHP